VQQCPSKTSLEEIAEAYLMHRLSEDQVEAFEEHYFACAACAAVIQRVAAYVVAMRAAVGSYDQIRLVVPPSPHVTSPARGRRERPAQRIRYP
jgi:hypothetical protein